MPFKRVRGKHIVLCMLVAVCNIALYKFFRDNSQRRRFVQLFKNCLTFPLDIGFGVGAFLEVPYFTAFVVPVRLNLVNEEDLFSSTGFKVLNTSVGKHSSVAPVSVHSSIVIVRTGKLILVFPIVFSAHCCVLRPTRRVIAVRSKNANKGALEIITVVVINIGKYIVLLIPGELVVVTVYNLNTISVKVTYFPKFTSVYRIRSPLRQSTIYVVFRGGINNFSGFLIDQLISAFATQRLASNLKAVSS